MAWREVWRVVDALQRDVMALERVVVMLVEDKLSELEKHKFERELRERFSLDD